MKARVLILLGIAIACLLAHQSYSDISIVPGGLTRSTVGAPGRYEPAQGMARWYRADAYTYQDTSGVTPATEDDDPVRLWRNFNLESGTGASEATNPPTLKLNVVNGRPVLRFDGTNDVLTEQALSTNITNSAGTVFAVANLVSVTTNAANYYQNDCVWRDQGNFAGLFASTGANKIGSYNWDGSADLAQSTTAVVGNWNIYTWAHIGGALKLGLNDTRSASLVSVASGNTTTLTGVVTFGFCSSTGSVFTEIDMEEWLAYPSDLTESQRVATERYLAERIGKALAY